MTGAGAGGGLYEGFSAILPCSRSKRLAGPARGAILFISYVVLVSGILLLFKYPTCTRGGRSVGPFLHLLCGDDIFFWSLRPTASGGRGDFIHAPFFP